MNAGRLLLRHELRLLAALGRWASRRPAALPQGSVAFGYARGQGAPMAGLGCVCVVETLMLSVLLRGRPTVHHVVLVLDVYAVVLVVALHASSVVYPHVLDPGAGTLRVRRSLHVDLVVPLERVVSVRRELRTTHERREGALDVVVGAQTSVTLELAGTVRHVTFLGRRREVGVVRLHADDPAALVRAVVAARDGLAEPA